MKTTDFFSWLTAWLTRHPLRNPPDFQQASYAAEVMARIRTSPLRAPAVAWWWRPRFALATGGAVAAVLIGLALRETPAQRLAGHLDREMQQLVQDEMTDDEAWLDETLELLDELDEEPDASSGDEGADGLIQELEWLDQQDLTS